MEGKVRVLHGWVGAWCPPGEDREVMLKRLRPSQRALGTKQSSQHFMLKTLSTFVSSPLRRLVGEL